MMGPHCTAIPSVREELLGPLSFAFRYFYAVVIRPMCEPDSPLWAQDFRRMGERTAVSSAKDTFAACQLVSDPHNPAARQVMTDPLPSPQACTAIFSAEQ